jgi:hypothetical protein
MRLPVSLSQGFVATNEIFGMLNDPSGIRGVLLRLCQTDPVQNQSLRVGKVGQISDIDVSSWDSLLGSMCFENS